MSGKPAFSATLLNSTSATTHARSATQIAPNGLLRAHAASASPIGGLTKPRTLKQEARKLLMKHKRRLDSA